MDYDLGRGDGKVNYYVRTLLIFSLAVTMAFASLTLCCAQDSNNLSHPSSSGTLLAQADQGSSSPTALPSSSSSCHVPSEYIRIINAGEYDKVGDLFSEDAVYLGPDGKTRHGAKTIGAFYAKFLKILHAKVTGVSFLENGNLCIMELGGFPSPGGNLKVWPTGSVPNPTAIDLFTIDSQGKASKFLVYVRPGTQAKVQAALSKVH